MAPSAARERHTAAVSSARRGRRSGQGIDACSVRALPARAATGRFARQHGADAGGGARRRVWLALGAAKAVTL
eukprot:4349588-Prymnesium_polylepis.2